MRLTVLFTFGLLGASLSACSSDPDPNDPSQFNQSGGYQQGGYQQGGYQQGYPAGTGTYPPGTATAPPTTTGTAPAAGGMATPIAPMAAAAATPVLQAMAASETRGMSPEGGAFAGQFQAGQVLEQTFNLNPGKCYTVVAASVGITELDVMIQTVAPLPGVPPITVAQDQGTGPNATLGGGGNCFKNALPIGAPAKVVVRATAGSGMAVAQIFVK